MSGIEISYRSYTLSFHEDNETWECRDLDIEPCPTLKACKAAVDRLSAKGRRLDVKALMQIGVGGRFRKDAEFKPVTVTILCETKKPRYGSIPSHQCWVTDANGERHKVRLEQLYPVDAAADLKGWLALEAAAKAAQAIADDAVVALSPFNVDSISLAAREAKAPKEDA